MHVMHIKFSIFLIIYDIIVIQSECHKFIGRKLSSSNDLKCPTCKL